MITAIPAAAPTRLPNSTLPALTRDRAMALSRHFPDPQGCGAIWPFLSLRGNKLASGSAMARASHGSPCLALVCTGAGGPCSRGYEHPDTREHLPRFRNLGQLEGDVAAVADVYGADLDQLLDARAIRRPAFLPEAYGEVLERSNGAVSYSPLAVPRRSVI